MREICTLGSVGAGGGRLPPATQWAWALSDERPYRDHRGRSAFGHAPDILTCETGSAGWRRITGEVCPLLLRLVHWIDDRRVHHVGNTLRAKKNHQEAYWLRSAVPPAMPFCARLKEGLACTECL